jgi:hypothetical protein
MRWNLGNFPQSIRLQHGLQRRSAFSSALRTVPKAKLLCAALIGAVTQRKTVYPSQQLCQPKRGMPTHRCQLGWMYAKDLGMPQDFVQAIPLVSQAADQGNAYAQANLGIAYLNGEGVERDLAQATKWLRKAADEGSPIAQKALGGCLRLVKGCRKTSRKPPRGTVRPPSKVRDDRVVASKGDCMERGCRLQASGATEFNQT